MVILVIHEASTNLIFPPEIALAFENIEASGTMDKQVAVEFTALKGSLALMSQVLSDILDL